jgi:heme-degrading monooxygenase HmoA
MSWKDPEKRRAAQKAYRQTPQGQEAHRRARNKYYAKRRLKHDDTPLRIDPSALASVLGSWHQRDQE